jgi:PAS domain S-box-containing protein
MAENTSATAMSINELRAVRAINETAALIASNLELDALVQTVVDIAVELTGAEFGAFFYNVIGDDGEAFSLYSLSGAERSAFSSYPHPRATPVFEPTFNGTCVVRSDDIMADPRYGQWAPHHGMPSGHLPVRSYLAVPVRSRSGEVIGGLFLGHAEPGRFAEWHERVAVGISHHAAVGIDNAHLYERAKGEIARREATEAQLRETERRLHAVLNNASVSIFLMNEVQHCVYMNAAAERLTGFTLDEVQGRPLHDVIHHTRPDGTPFPLSECAIDRAFPENANTQGEEVFVHKSGPFYPVAFTASPVHDEKAKVVGTIIEVRDISEEKKVEEARELLMREVDHRARNVMAVVQSLVRLTKASDLESYKNTLAGRINAIARAQTSLANRQWEDGWLVDVVRDELAALCPKEQVSAEGPPVALSPEKVQRSCQLKSEVEVRPAEKRFHC